MTIPSRAPRFAFLLVAALSLAVQPPLIAQESDAAAARFLGMWRLVSWTVRGADGTTRPGTTDQGYLVYTDVGRMCAVMAQSTRAKWAPEPPKTVPEAMARYAGFVSYCARVEVNAREGYVLHHVDIERSPNIVGTIRKRWYSFDGPNRVTLRIDKAELQPPTTESTLVWERVTK